MHIFTQQTIGLKYYTMQSGKEIIHTTKEQKNKLDQKNTSLCISSGDMGMREGKLREGVVPSMQWRGGGE